ncbi:MAG: tripartite tricarboxylate transporter TctB family protein [Rubrivivax sp.]
MAPQRRADLIFAVVLTALALWVLVESWRMPRLVELGVHPMSAPGLTPGLIALVLTGLGLALLWRSVRGPALAPQDDEAAAANTVWWRALLALMLCLVYALGLLGHLPFLWATGLFVFAFIASFSFNRERPLRSLGGAALMALAVAVSVSLLFEQLFLVRLP